MALVMLMTDVEHDALKEQSRKSLNGVVHRIIRNSEAEKSPPGIICTAVQPFTYIQPHRHPHANELYFFHSGECNVVLFTPAGEIERSIVFPSLPSSQDRSMSFEVPANTWHTILAVKESLLYSVYGGIYDSKKPEEYKEIPSWCPLRKKEKERYISNLIRTITSSR